MNAPEHAAHGEEPDVHELDHHLSDYKKIITALSVLTAIEFGISHLMAIHTMGFTMGVVILVALAFVKAALVAKFFMHLRYDPKPLAVMCVIPLVLASPILVICCFDAIKGPAI
jgi:caa(3)-type oxidase subunit IV